jgi:hypothetical protein
MLIVVSLELGCTGATGGMSGVGLTGSCCAVTGAALKGISGGSMVMVSCYQAVGCRFVDLSR